VAVVDEAHPLCGERLKAVSFRRGRGALRLVVVLPDGTPGMVPASATDVLGSAGGDVPARVGTTLSVEGVRRLRSRVQRAELTRPAAELTRPAQAKARG
jgi:hypothetical protein